MSARRSWLAGVAGAAALAFATGAQAACPPLPGDAFAFLPVDVVCPATPIVRFAEPEVHFECGLLDTAEHAITCGEPTLAGCVDVCRAAAATWNADLPGRFTFITAGASENVAFCDNADGKTSVGGSDTVCDGSPFGANVLAVTFRFTIISGPRKGEQLDADVSVNQAFDSLYASNPGLFHATLGHEFGHVLGLDHPDRCGHGDNVLMHSTIGSPADPCFVEVPTADDITGAKMIYALTAPTPTPTPGLCGDADGSGTVDVIDAANVLRAAVLLPSSCTAQPSRCDVNGSGGVDVIDAANVLRHAVALPAAQSCP